MRVDAVTTPLSFAFFTMIVAARAEMRRAPTSDQPTTNLDNLKAHVLVHKLQREAIDSGPRDWDSHLTVSVSTHPL